MLERDAFLARCPDRKQGPLPRQEVLSLRLPLTKGRERSSLGRLPLTGTRDQAFTEVEGMKHINLGAAERAC